MSKHTYKQNYSIELSFICTEQIDAITGSVNIDNSSVTSDIPSFLTIVHEILKFIQRLKQKLKQIQNRIKKSTRHTDERIVFLRLFTSFGEFSFQFNLFLFEVFVCDSCQQLQNNNTTLKHVSLEREYYCEIFLRVIVAEN